jgi:uncharacterized protein (TIGR03000 family)
VAPPPSFLGGGPSTGSDGGPSDQAAHLVVRVPADAEVWFGTGKTTQTGATREFVSPPLSPGQEYTYEVRARWTESAKEMDQVRQVDVAAGSLRFLDFTRPAPEVVLPPKPFKP